MKPYFYVYNRANRLPTIKHYTIEDAVQEAERLAALHPSQGFEILACIAITSIPKANTFWMDGVQPPVKHSEIF